MKTILIFLFVCNFFSLADLKIIPKLDITKRQQSLSYKKFSLVYDKDRKSAIYTLYKLTREMVEKQGVKRTNRFIPDKRVSDCPITTDYTKTGFDRGHLVPAEDMDDDSVSMQESFYMTNMVPQLPKFNRGIWKRMEDTVRIFAKNYNEVNVISGPVYDSLPDVYEINNGIDIPTRFYKILYYEDNGILKAEAYLFENKEYKQTKRNPVFLSKFKVSIEKIEQIVKIDFFPYN